MYSPSTKETIGKHITTITFLKFNEALSKVPKIPRGTVERFADKKGITLKNKENRMSAQTICRHSVHESVSLFQHKYQLDSLFVAPSQKGICCTN